MSDEPVREAADEEPDPDPPPLGPAKRKPRPLRGPRPGVQRPYDPGVTPPADDDPWQDEGHPETNG